MNLTGNSASGARGNNRQIDLRGMGPENTLILIDGKPSSARNAVRYGSGAMGGVVNIITKRPSEELKGSISLYTQLPKDSAEGASRRANFNLSGGLTDNLGFRLYGCLAKTDADDLDINAGHATSALAAGREGVRIKDINGLLSWKLNDEHRLEASAGYSRQGNIFAGDTMNSNGGGDVDSVSSLYGHETNVMQRSTYDLTHLGDFTWGTSKTTLAYEYVRNWRLNEGLAGRTEGAPNDEGRAMSRLRSTRLSSEVNLPFAMGSTEHVLTVGGEYLYEALNDQGSLRPQSSAPSISDGIVGFDRSRVTQWDNAGKARVEGVEGNFFIEVTPTLDWNTNLTWMLDNDNRETGEPLSVIPEYTVNTSLDWRATEQLSFQLAGTYFGKQKSPTYNYRTQQDYDKTAQQDVEAYGLVDVSAGYRFNANYDVRVGVNNVFDKQILRGGNASSSGANTYNQPGRALFAALNINF